MILIGRQIRIRQILHRNPHPTDADFGWLHHIPGEN